MNAKTSRSEAVGDNGPALSGKRTKVKFSRNPDAGGNPNNVYIGINGVTYGYQYETEVEVPDEVLEVADNALMEKFYMDEKNNLVSQTVRRFPYSVVR